MSNKSLKGTTWAITNKNGKSVLDGTFSTNTRGLNNYSPKAYNYEVIFNTISQAGDYTFKLADGNSIEFNISDDPYSKYAASVIRYLKQQRSGSTEAIDHPNMCHAEDANRPLHIKDVAADKWVIDPKGRTADLKGGWYDAGDYIKFTLTTAYTSYLLGRAYNISPEIFQTKKYSKSDLNDALDELKWGLDFLMKCYVDEETFLIQVGDESDHKEGLRMPEDDKLATQRKAYSCLSSTQMGYTSAALTMGAKIFKKEGKADLAKKYLDMAIKVYKLGKKNRFTIDWYQHGHEIFYKDEKSADNMELAATELYKLTNEKEYLTDAKDFALNAQAGYWASWGSSNLLAHTKLAPLYPKTEEFLATDLQLFKSKADMTGNIWNTPHDFTWATLYSFMAVGNGAMSYSYYANDKTYLPVGQNVVDYVFGLNNWGKSFLASKDLNPSFTNVYSQIYKLNPSLYPEGAIAEGPGDANQHADLSQYFKIPEDSPEYEFNTPMFLFFDNNSDFQCTETTISGLGDGLLMLALAKKELNK